MRVHRPHLGLALTALGFCIVVVDAVANVDGYRPCWWYDGPLATLKYPAYLATVGLTIAGDLLLRRR